MSHLVQEVLGLLLEAQFRGHEPETLGGAALVDGSGLDRGAEVSVVLSQALNFSQSFAHHGLKIVEFQGHRQIVHLGAVEPVLRRGVTGTRAVHVAHVFLDTGMLVGGLKRLRQILTIHLLF